MNMLRLMPRLLEDLNDAEFWQVSQQLASPYSKNHLDAFACVIAHLCTNLPVWLNLLAFLSASKSA